MHNFECTQFVQKRKVKWAIVFLTLLQHKRRLQVLFFFLSLELGKATSYPFGKNKYFYLWRSKEMAESFRCIFLRIIVFDSLLLIQKTHINVMLSGKFMKQKKKSTWENIHLNNPSLLSSASKKCCALLGKHW